MTLRFILQPPLGVPIPRLGTTILLQSMQLFPSDFPVKLNHSPSQSLYLTILSYSQDKIGNILKALKAFYY